jgi:hypothetical protein
MSHPLDGAWRRVDRADRYIKELRTLFDEWASECEGAIVEAYDIQAGNYVRHPTHIPDIPADVPLALSDAVHNLRSALDYLVYELALLDSKAIQDNTQFPIEDCKVGKSPRGKTIGFDAITSRYLKGLCPVHVAAIERLQPYNGANWTKTLREISNPDKHRRLTPTRRGESINVWVYAPDSPNRPGRTLPSGYKIHIDPTHTLFIVLPEGDAPIIPTLE